MKTINLNLFDKKSIFTTLQNDLGGKLTTYHKETEFEIDKQLGSGSIRGIELENGVTFLEFDLELDGASDLHYELICSVVGDYTIEGEHENERLNRLKNSYETS